MTNLRTSPGFVPPTTVDYDKLNAADKSLVDRAIFDHVVKHQGNGFAFADAELRLHGGKAPDSKQIEFDIQALRELHADRLKAGGRAELTREAAGAPANATSMLNAIKAFNGNECRESCRIPRPVNLDQILGSGRGR